jgi:hypothetical protein
MAGAFLADSMEREVSKMSGAQNLRVLLLVIVASSTLNAARAQIPPRPVTPRPAASVPKADSIPKPVFVGESAEEAAIREAVERALDKNVDIEFGETPLTDVAKRLSELSGIKVELDRRALEDSGIAPDTKVSLSLRQISLRSALRILLRRIDLCYVNQDGGLLITDTSKASTMLMTALYPVADLIDCFDSSGRRVKDYTPIIELITSYAAPASWDTVGGPGGAKEYDGLLAVSQTPEVLAQIETLLRTLRVVRERQSKGDFSPLSGETENENTIRVLKALESTVNLDCRETPLAKLAELVAIESGVNVLLDERSLVDAGIALDSKVDGTAKGVPLRAALKRLLRDLNMTYHMRDEVLFLTTVEMARYTTLKAHVFPLDDLFRGSFDDERDGFGESIVELIASTIAPTTWDGVGGAGYLRFYGAWNVLIVSNTAETQSDIADLLQKLRTLREKQDRSALLRDDIETRVYRLGSPAGAIATTKEAEVLLKSSDAFFDAKELTAAIRELIEPESWKEQGVDLRVLGDRIIVRHRRTIHARVQQFLRELQAPDAVYGSISEGGGGS